MKNMRDHLFTLGASAVLTLSMVLAQDQAPQLPAPLPDAAAPAEAAAGQPPPAPAAAPAVAEPAAAPLAPAAVVPAPAAPAKAVPGLPAATTTRRPAFIPSKRTAAPAAVTPGSMAPALSTEPAAGGEAKSKTTTPSLKFDSTPADIIVSAYCEQTGKTPLWAPDAPKVNITLKSQAGVELTKEEFVEAIEVVLSMNGIVLEPFGEKFVKVLAKKTVRSDGIKILMDSPEGGHPEKSKVVSQMIQLKSILISEVQKALEGFKKPDGMIQTFERTNSLLVTDTQENVNRMLEIVKFIDQPLVATEEVNVRVVRFAKAEDIKKRIEELVSESQKQTQAKEEVKTNTAGAPGTTRTLSPTTSRPMPPGLSRLGAQPTAATPNEILETLVSDADRGMIRGKVQIIADERSNQLIIITRKENMNFFDKIITVLDIETSPDVKVEVQRLEFADAEEVSTMLNDLIGNATAAKKDSKSPTNPKGTATSGTSGSSDQAARSSTLAETLAARASHAAESAVGEAGKTKLGALSKDNIKILADKRTNAIVMMGSTGDLAAIKEIIKGMDIQLSQVLIETVVLQVSLKNDIQTGVDWVKRVDFNNVNYRYNLSGGGGRTPPTDLSLLTAVATGMVSSASSGLQYFATLKDLRLDAVISATKSDNGAKVLSSPILLTVDNKEATIEATETIYMYKGMRYMGYSTTGSGAGSYEPDIEQRDVGLTVKITPRINPSGNVILTVEEKFEDVLGSQTIQDQSWPTVTTRKLSADVSVGSGETVILGGLVKTSKSEDSSGIPLLKDIPYIGKYLFGTLTKKDERSEMLVFLTPYVIENQSDMDRETRRRKDYINADGVWTKGWSDSKLSDPVSDADMKQRLERNKGLEKAWQKYRESLGKQQELNAKIETQRALTQDMAPVTDSSDAPKAGRMTVDETVEVLKPEGAPAEVDPKPEAAPLQPEVEEPKKSWWNFF